MWGAEPPASAAHAVEVYVSRLRELLGPAAVVTTAGPSYALAARIDAVEFERLLAAGRVREALALWRGPALAYDGSARTELARLEELRLEAVEARAEGDVAELEALVAANPLRERLRARLMLALYRAGRQADALAAYREGRRVLVEELGLEPGEELRELEAAILRQDPALDAPAASAVPAAATPLVGRAEELAELLSSEARLITVTGPGGVGKTRLAIAAAERLGGVFVDLSALRDPELVAGEIARTLGLRDADALASHLAARALLLVLDNFEQVDDAAPVVADLLRGAPGLRVLVTSRGRLRLYGEHELALRPLPAEQAAELFAARARARDHRFTVTDPDALAAINRRVEGLPLAIELVAARIGELTLGEMAKGLGVLDLAGEGPRDAPARHRGLRATIDWSCDLLASDAESVFARLGVFAGGFDLEAAQAVADADARVLGELAGVSLLRRSPGRWEMLETIRERALEQLPGGDPAGARHVEHFLALAERSEEELKGPDQRAWGERMEREHDNLRAAFDRADPKSALRIAAALGWFWYTHGHAEEGAARLERALAAEPEAPALLRGRATHVRGVLLTQRNQLDAAEACFRAGLELFREAGDERRAAGSLNSLAAAARNRCRFAEARELFQQAVALRRAIGDVKALADPLSNLGIVAIDEGDLARAGELLRESLAIDRAHANDWGVAVNLGNLGALALEQGRLGEADELLGQAVRALRPLGDRWSLLQTLERCAELAAARGDVTRAARLAGAAAAQRERLGEPNAAADARIVERHLAPVRGAEGFAAAWEAGAALTLEQALDEA